MGDESKFTRQAFNAPPRVVSALEDLELRGFGESKTEVLNRAVLLAHRVTGHVEQGGALILRRSDGTEVEVVFL